MSCSRDSATRDAGDGGSPQQQSSNRYCQKQMAPVATTMVNYMAGSRTKIEGAPGTAHAQAGAYAVSRGTRTVRAQLANIIAEMDGNFNAETQQSNAVFFTVPSEDLDIALRIEAIRMSGIFDSEGNHGKVKEKQSSKKRPQVVGSGIFLLHATLGRHVHNSYANSGWVINSFDSISGSMLKKFYDTWYAPNNASRYSRTFYRSRHSRR